MGCPPAFGKILKQLANPMWATLEYAWQPLLLLVSTPWFLHRLGVEQYGQWMMLAATVSLGGILASGTGAATVRTVSAGHDPLVADSAGCAVRASLMIALVGGAILGLLVVCLFWFGGDSLLAKVGGKSTIRMTGIVAAILLWIEQVDNVFSSAIKGSLRFGHAAILEIASRTVQLLLVALMLWPYPTLGAVYVVLVLVACCRLVLKAAVARRLLGMASLRPTHEGVMALLDFAKWGWLLGVGGVLFGTADRLLIGSLLGVSALAYYSIASQLAMQIHALSAAGCSVIFPLASRHFRREDIARLRRAVIVALVVNTVMSSLLALALYLLSPLFLGLWVGSAAATQVLQIMPYLVIAYWILAMNIVPYYMMLGVNRIKFVGIGVIVAGLLGTVSLYVLLPVYGFVASPSGKVVYAVITLVLLFPFARFMMRRDGHARPLVV